MTDPKANEDDSQVPTIDEVSGESLKSRLCPHGHNVDSTQSFCGACGAQVVDGLKMTSSDTSKWTFRRKVSVLGVSSAVIIAATIGVVVALNSGGSNNLSSAEQNNFDYCNNIVGTWASYILSQSQTASTLIAAENDWLNAYQDANINGNTNISQDVVNDINQAIGFDASSQTFGSSQYAKDAVNNAQSDCEYGDVPTGIQLPPS
jgi:hypothetical protein